MDNAIQVDHDWLAVLEVVAVSRTTHDILVRAGRILFLSSLTIICDILMAIN